MKGYLEKIDDNWMVKVDGKSIQLHSNDIIDINNLTHTGLFYTSKIVNFQLLDNGVAKLSSKKIDSVNLNANRNICLVCESEFVNRSKEICDTCLNRLSKIIKHNT